MSTHPITISWEILISMCSEGARLTRPSRPNEEAICVAGLSTDATIEQVIVNADRTITIVCNDPHFGGGAVGWLLVQKPEPPTVSTEGAAWALECSCAGSGGIFPHAPHCPASPEYKARYIAARPEQE